MKKKMILKTMLAVCSCVCVLLFGTLCTEASQYQLGDINEKDGVNAEDALMALQSAAQIVELNEYQHTVADVNKDGAVSAEDALQILQVAAKLDVFHISTEMMAGDTYTIDKIFDVGQYAWVYAELTPAGGLTIEKEVLPLPGDSPIGQTPEQVYTVSAEKAGVYELCFRLCPVNDPEADAVEERIYEITVKENSQTALELKKGETYVIDQIFDQGSSKW